MLIFKDVWGVATTQTAKYGRFDKALLMRYNPGWCRFDVVHVIVHAHAPPHFLHLLAYSIVPGSPPVSRYT